MADLVELHPGLYVFMADDDGPGRANSGVIVDADGLTVIDAQLTPRRASQLHELCQRFEAPIRRLVLTSSHLPYVGGSGVFALPGVYGTPQVSVHLEQPPNIEGCCALYPNDAPDIMAIDERPTRKVTHTVAEAAWLTPSLIAAPLAGELAEGLVVQVPSASIVFGGALCSFGVTPMAGSGDPGGWADSLETVKTWGTIVIPGHGPIGGAEEVDDLAAYLRACVAAEGDPARIGDGPWDTWSGREYDAVNVERAAMLAAGDDDPPPSLLALLGM